MARGQLAGDEHVGLRARLAEIEKKWTEAAQLYQQAQLPVHAAVAFEKAKQYPDAAAAWKSLAPPPGPRARARTRRRSSTSTTGSRRCGSTPNSGEARRALIESQRKLEQVADDFEQVGELERAFDCFQILLKLGKEIVAVREPRRGLRQLHPRAARRQPQVLRPPVLRGLHQARARARRAPRGGDALSGGRGVRGARGPAVRPPLPAQERADLGALRREVRRDRRAGPDDRERAARGGVAALRGRRLPGGARVLRASSPASSCPSARRSGSRRSRSATRASRRRRSSCPGLPDYLKQQHAYADIWFVDLLEWEMDGDPYAVAASIVGDLRYPNGIRRRALVVLLTLADAQARKAEGETETLVARRRAARRAAVVRRAVAAREAVRVAATRRSAAPRSARCASSTSSARS